jgi:hypothetical protein
LILYLQIRSLEIFQSLAKQTDDKILRVAGIKRFLSSLSLLRLVVVYQFKTEFTALCSSENFKGKKIMDLLQLQAAIETILNYIFSQGPDGIQQLITILQMIVHGSASLGGIATFIAKTPALVEVSSQLLALITSGAGIPEIASALVQFATALGVSADALIHLLQMIASFLLLF